MAVLMMSETCGHFVISHTFGGYFSFFLPLFNLLVQNHPKHMSPSDRMKIKVMCQIIELCDLTGN